LSTTRQLISTVLLLALLGTGSLAAAKAPSAESSKKRSASTLSKIVSNARVRQVLVVRSSRAGQGRRVLSLARIEPARLSMGQLIGLHQAADSLDLKSGVALVVDQDTDEILFSKNPQAVLPIASLTKLMTAVVVVDAGLPLDETITITDEDIDTEKGSRSRLKIGTQLRREEMLHLALMASENRAAHALGRSFPGGLNAFVAAMNAKARELGMKDTRYVEPTGLSSRNQSSARDLATLVKAAHEVQIIRELSTSPEYLVEVDNRSLQFRNTNGLVKNPEWEIGLQKTGYISEAGRCLVMQAKLAGRHLIMVFLDSAGKYSRIGDAERVRRWIIETAPVLPVVLTSQKPGM
jgi:D-alanyl-D-alanine endopeptidase (penicillin-binding protein 7)